MIYWRATAGINFQIDYSTSKIEAKYNENVNMKKIAVKLEFLNLENIFQEWGQNKHFMTKRMIPFISFPIDPQRKSGRMHFYRKMVSMWGSEMQKELSKK